MKKTFIKAIDFIARHKFLAAAASAAALAAYWAATGDSHSAWAMIAPGVVGGAHIANEPLTLAATDEAAPGLLRNEIDERVTKIRPMATPIDQISRLAGARRAGAMTVDYYAVDTLSIHSKVTQTYTPTSGKTPTSDAVVTLYVEDASSLAPGDTLLVRDVTGSDGNAQVLYVMESNYDENKIKVMSTNDPAADSNGYRTVSAIPEESVMIRMGRAAGELDVQTTQYQALPKKSSNLCQIFKSQIEQSTLQSIANKEVGWGFSDQEELAVLDMRQAMEKSFIFGHKAKIYDKAKGSDIYLTGGIWYQAGNEYLYNEGNLTNNDMVSLCQKAFTGHSGSSRKVLVAGSKLIESISRIEIEKSLPGKEVVTRWGIDFNEIVTKFGTLYVVMSEIFDQCGHADDGIIVDPEYITKYCHQPFHTKLLDLKSAGVRNTDAVVITEASCLVLRYPQAHTRVIGI